MMEREQAIQLLEEAMERYSDAPLLEQMEHRTLETKQISGATAAHAIEEIHVPLNYAYLTFTTGTSAFQTPVAVTREELEERKKAGSQALLLAGVCQGSRALITYPPLVNVFSRETLEEYGITKKFLKRSCREALLSEWCRDSAEVTIGESSFLRSVLEDAFRMGCSSLLPKRMILLAAGTPLDRELPELLKELEGWILHDLYGCQEFGWLTLDGIPLRNDLVLISENKQPELVYPVVGGLAVGDCFQRGAHCLNPHGILATHSRRPAASEWETWLIETTAQDRETVRRLAKSVLRIKSRIVRVDPGLTCKQEQTKVLLRPTEGGEAICLMGPKQTRLLDSLLEAQKNYQIGQKRDSVWSKIET